MTGVQLILASSSPRRHELLRQLAVAFAPLVVDVDETPRPSEPPAEFVLRLALDKAQTGAQRGGQPQLPVLGADTAVVVDGRILGKPRDEADALAMLALLGGRSHEVYTGVAMCHGGRTQARLSVSTVTFRPVSDAERVAYWATGEPVGKAGGYAIQGRAAAFVSRLEGSYSGVMGLPLFETSELLRWANVDTLVSIADDN